MTNEQRSVEEAIIIRPTVLYRAQRSSEEGTTEEAVTARHLDGHALVLFRNEEEAEKFRADTGKYPQEEGFEAVHVDLMDLARLVVRHDCSHICMPEAWGAGAVDFFGALEVLTMLKESQPA